MKYVTAYDLDLTRSAGREIWMLAYTEGLTRILNPQKVFLYIEHTGSPRDKKLTLVTIDDDGNITNVFDEDDLPDNTTVFLGNERGDIFAMYEVITIQERLMNDVQASMTYRIDNNYEQNTLFESLDNPFDDY